MYIAEMIVIYGTIIVSIGFLINFIIYFICNKNQKNIIIKKKIRWIKIMNYKHNNEIMYFILASIIGMVMCVIGFAILMEDENIINSIFGFAFLVSGLILLLLVLHTIGRTE